CVNPRTDITTPGSGQYSSDLTGLHNVLDPVNAGNCGNWSHADGPDEVWEVTIPAGGIVSAYASRKNAWQYQYMYFYLITDCSDLETCLIGGNSTGSSVPLFYENTGSSMTAYLVVDSFSTSAGEHGEYDLSVYVGPMPDCDNPREIAVSSGSTETFYGNTEDLDNNFDDTSDPITCMGGSYETAGPDEVWKISVPDGKELTVTMTASHYAFVYFVTDCSDPTGSCVAGDGDRIDPVETYINSSGGAQDIYIVCDSSSGSYSGAYDIQVTIDNP
ncbi:MAG: hypothetical protein GY847_25460, partial [Proteobacteria bacterium]|nr:hypothetical protein [Pseudomonadota bacterium]